MFMGERETTVKGPTLGRGEFKLEGHTWVHKEIYDHKTGEVIETRVSANRDGSIMQNEKITSKDGKTIFRDTDIDFIGERKGLKIRSSLVRAADEEHHFLLINEESVQYMQRFLGNPLAAEWRTGEKNRYHKEFEEMMQK